jgi:hypothetical protein
VAIQPKVEPPEPGPEVLDTSDWYLLGVKEVKNDPVELVPFPVRLFPVFQPPEGFFKVIQCGQ